MGDDRIGNSPHFAKLMILMDMIAFFINDDDAIDKRIRERFEE